MLGNVPKRHVAIADQGQVRDGFLAQPAIVDVRLEPMALFASIIDGVGLVWDKGFHRWNRANQSLESRKDDFSQDIRKWALWGIDSAISQIAMDTPSFTDEFPVEQSRFPGRKDVLADVDTIFHYGGLFLFRDEVFVDVQSGNWFARVRSRLR